MTIQEFLAKYSLTMTATPKQDEALSESMVGYSVTITAPGKKPFTMGFSMGVGHIEEKVGETWQPYRGQDVIVYIGQKKATYGGRLYDLEYLMGQQISDWRIPCCIHLNQKNWRDFQGGVDIIARNFRPAAPTIDTVLECLASDVSESLDYGFEAWADESGYDTDSRKAEKIYKACLDMRASLLVLLGREGLADLFDIGF